MNTGPAKATQATRATRPAAQALGTHPAHGSGPRERGAEPAPADGRPAPAWMRRQRPLREVRA